MKRYVMNAVLVLTVCPLLVQGAGIEPDLSLCHQVKPGVVPTLLFHGTEDTTVPFENAERFAGLMKEAGNECVFVPFEGQGHGFFNGSHFRARNGDDAFNETMKHSVTFLAAHGYVTAPGDGPRGDRPSERPVPAWKRGVYHESVPAPSLSGVRYGAAHRNVLDFWRAPSDMPTPLVLSIHGGGWNGGAKEKIDSYVNVADLLEAGISVAAINYRLIKHSKELEPHVKGPLSDAARAVQFLRSKADEWNIDATRIAATGGSAGGCSSLWVAYHDDLADPGSDDPVARESTRLTCVAPLRAQTTLDPKQMKAWIPNSKYGAHAFGLESFSEFLAERDRILSTINEYSPYALLDSEDPPTYLFFTKAPAIGREERDPTHSAVFGAKLQERCKELGVSCELVYPGAPGVKHATPTDYLIATLRPEATEAQE